MKIKYGNVEIKLSGKWQLVLGYSHVYKTWAQVKKFHWESIYSVAFLQLSSPQEKMGRF